MEAQVMKVKYIIATVLGAALLLGVAGCTSNDMPEKSSGTAVSGTEDTTQTSSVAVVDSGKDYLAGFDTFDVTSTDLQDGKWADIISNTDRGENVSPQLSWAPVEGAAAHAVYMVDMSTNGFIHWKSNGITECDLARGWASSKEFIGPWPAPGDEHIYEVYVIALKSPVERLKGGLNGINPKIEEFIRGLDTDSNGNTGNIIAYGRLAGTFKG